MCDPITTCFHPSIVGQALGASFPDSLPLHVIPSTLHLVGPESPLHEYACPCNHPVS